MAREIEISTDGPNWGSKHFPPHLQYKYLDLIRLGYSKRKAATDCGLTANQVWNFRKANPEFDEEIAQAEYEAADLVEDVLMEKILIERHYPAMVFWLVNRTNGRWKDIRQITMTTPENANEQKAVVHDILNRLKEENK